RTGLCERSAAALHDRHPAPVSVHSVVPLVVDVVRCDDANSTPGYRFTVRSSRKPTERREGADTATLLRALQVSVVVSLGYDPVPVSRGPPGSIPPRPGRDRSGWDSWPAGRAGDRSARRTPPRATRR